MKSVFAFTNLLTLFTMLVLCTFTPPRVSASDTERDLRISVARLNSWLGADENARRWRQILNLNVLDAQAALGHRADWMALLDVHHRFESGLPGLEHTVFRQVSSAIAAHLDQLPRNNQDIGLAIENAKPGFRPVSLSALQEMRESAVYDLKLLKRYYKKQLASRTRALLFYELKPDETVEFFSDLDFELPPARSQSVIEAEIETNQRQIEFIEKQLEQLNEQREKALQWLKQLESVRPPEGVEPPMPDDDDEPGLQEPAPADGASTSVGQAMRESTTANQLPQDQIEEIDARRLRLQQNKQDFQDEIERLKKEVVELRASERERNRRFLAAFRQLNSYLRPYEELVSRRSDMFFGNALQSMLKLKTAYLRGASPFTERRYPRQLDKLQEARMLLDSSNDRRAAANVGALTGWIEAAGQAPDLVGAIRKKYSLPNLHVSITNRLVNQVGSRPVNEVERVNEQILGRLIRGIAYVDGDVAIQFLPDPWQVRAAIDLSANIHSDTFARSGPFTAYTGADSPVNFRREIYANTGGLFAGQVYGDLQVNSFFKCIDSQLGLVQRVALREYGKTKRRAEEISRERTISRVLPDFEEQTQKALGDAYEQFSELIKEKTDNGLLLPAIYVHTTSDRLVAIGHRSTSFDLAAPQPPLNYNYTDDDIQVRVHESLPSNYISPIVAGKTLTNKQIEEKIKEFLGDAFPAPTPGEGAEAAEAQPDEEFTITFDEARPIQFEFEGNTIAVTVSGTRFARANETIDNGLRIRVAVKIIRNDGQLQLVPASEVQVELIDPKKKNIATVNFMSFLETKLSQVLRQAFETDVILPPNLVPVDKLGPEIQPIAGLLQLVQLRMEGGWLYTGWKHQSSLWNRVTAVDLPAIWPPVNEPLLLPDAGLPSVSYNQPDAESTTTSLRTD